MGTDNIPPISRPALIIVDMQNDFIRAGAPLEVPGGRQLIDCQQHLLGFFRAHRLPVVFLRWLSVANDPKRRLQGKFAWMSLLNEDTQACRLGTTRSYQDRDAPLECSAVIDELVPQGAELSIFKYGYGGFYGTVLGEHLAQSGVDTLVVAGVVAECCVEDTVRQAWNHAYSSIVVRDAVAGMTEHNRNTSLAVIDENYGWVASTDEVIALLQRSPHHPGQHYA